MGGCRSWLCVLLLCCLAAVAAASVSSVDTATLRSLGLSRKEIKEARSNEPIEADDEEEEMMEIDDEEEPWKSNEDWWKDPLAMFSDDEEEMVEEIDETVPIIDEAGSLGEQIAVEEEAQQVEEADEVMEEDLVTPEPDAVAEEAPPQVKTKPTAPVKKEKAATQKQKVRPVKEKAAKNDTRVAKTNSGSAGSFSSPLALLVPLLPKVQGMLTNAPMVPLAASAVAITFYIGTVKNKKGGKMEIEGGEHLDDAIDEEIMSERQEDALEEEMEQEEENQRTELSMEPAERRHIMPHIRTPGWMRSIRDRFARTPDGQRIPSARDLYRQVETLQQSLSKAQSERDAMEKEYENRSFQLQEAQAELKSLTSTTRYLKAQLRDNEDVKNKAVRAEQRKAKEELGRMKEAMVAILEKERKAMRAELKRQATELRALLTEATNGANKGEYTSEES